MVANKRHWSEIGRVKNSEWFRNLPLPEQRAIMDALEVDTHESAVRFRATLAIVYLAALYTIAASLWAFALEFHPLLLSVGGALAGIVLGFLASNAIVRQKTPADAAAMQSVTGLTFGLPGALIALAGLIALVVRYI